MTEIGMHECVRVNLFDGQIKDKEGHVIGTGHNSAGETVYLVEMSDDVSQHSEKEVGTCQLERGKKWVLSLYGEELTPAIA